MRGKSRYGTSGAYSRAAKTGAVVRLARQEKKKNSAAPKLMGNSICKTIREYFPSGRVFASFITISVPPPLGSTKSFCCIFILFVYFLFPLHLIIKTVQNPCKMFPKQGKNCIRQIELYSAKIFLCIFWYPILLFLHIYKQRWANEEADDLQCCMFLTKRTDFC